MFHPDVHWFRTLYVLVFTCRESPSSRTHPMDPSNVSGLRELLEALRDHQSPNTVIQKRALKVSSNYSFLFILNSPESSSEYYNLSNVHLLCVSLFDPLYITRTVTYLRIFSSISLSILVTVLMWTCPRHCTDVNMSFLSLY